MEILHYLREFNTVSVIVRLTLAMILSGVIGIEREHKRRPAGLRTHIITCLGATLTMLTSQYLIKQGYNTDVGRLSAQVIAGIGFIGAGTILVTRNRKVKGLTTAAGFWASAIIGLAIGAGYYEGAVIASCLVLMAELLFTKFEYFITERRKNISVLIEYTDDDALGEAILFLEKHDVKITGLDVLKKLGDDKSHVVATFSLHVPHAHIREIILHELSQLSKVISVNEI